MQKQNKDLMVEIKRLKTENKALTLENRHVVRMRFSL
jgi:regulator of replication initiation timing